MLEIEFLPPKFLIKKENGKELIKDAIRKKWVRLTPEEWVRQNIIQYLLQTKQYPASLLSIEKEIRLGELKKRCDVVIYKDDKPWMIIECKQPDVSLTEATLMQVLRYNMVNSCSYLIISNGNKSKGWHLENGGAEEIYEIPDWK